jgi:hypothetical protein
MNTDQTAPLGNALENILADPRVTPAGDGYVVTREGGAVLFVRPLPRNGDWGSFLHRDGKTSYARMIPGSLAQGKEKAVAWALR